MSFYDLKQMQLINHDLKNGIFTTCCDVISTPVLFEVPNRKSYVYKPNANVKHH